MGPITKVGLKGLIGGAEISGKMDHNNINNNNIFQGKLHNV